MEIWQAAVLGLIQGLTEFLPVSSSGHIAFFQGIFGINDENATFFMLILHLGTLVAVCAVFWKDILNLFRKPFKTLGFLVLASVPAAVIGLLVAAFDLDSVFLGENIGIFLGVFFFLTAVLLFVTETVVKRRQNLLPLCFRTVVPMGLAQAVAVLPGISRSGSTICAGTLAGGRSEDIAKFSFLMSIPVILGSFVVELAVKLYKGEIQSEFAGADGVVFGWSIALGFVIAAAAGLFAIKLMLKVIQKANYKWFSLYLVLLSVTCIILHFTYFNI